MKKAKRCATPEQKAAAAARRDKIKALWATVAEMSDAERVRFADRLGAVTTPEGHPMKTCFSLRLPSGLGRLNIQRLCENPPAASAIDEAEKLVAYWREHIAAAPDYQPDQERLVVVLLNAQLRPIGWHLITLGTVNQTLARPVEIFRPVVVCNAYACAVMHNHPSGETAPSEADKKITSRLIQGAKTLELTLLDHVIVTEPDRIPEGSRPYFSFKECGLI